MLGKSPCVADYSTSHACDLSSIHRRASASFSNPKSYRCARDGAERLRNADAGLRIAGTQIRELTGTRASGLGWLQGID